MSSQLTDLRGLAMGARFLAALPGFLRRPTTPDGMRSTHELMRSTRERRFIDLTRRTAFGRPGSVMGRLLAHAGVSEGDLEEMVDADGLEGVLDRLFEAGVYLTVDEFKGRAPVVRGSLTIETGPDSFENPLASPHVVARSGGSRSRAGPFLIDMEFARACGVVYALMMEAWGIPHAAKADWEAPGAGSRFRLVKLASFGSPPAAWFTPIDPADRDLDRVFRVSDVALRMGGRLAGVPLPAPRLATGMEPLPVARWMRMRLDDGETPLVFCLTSAAVCLSVGAVEAGVDLTGGYVTCGGEPSTGARLRSISKSGLTPIPRYGSIEAGPVGWACTRAEHADHVHVVADLHAVIQAGSAGADRGLPGSALLITALHPRAPFTMLNLSLGDRAELAPSRCGCPLEDLGWRTTLYDIRSFEKFTAAGVTFHERDVVRLLEVTLPERFGGGPADYQLVESDGPAGRPRLRIVADPRLGELDEPALIRALLDGLGSASPIARVMEKQLADAAELSVERRPPLRTRSGKVLHLHVENRGA
ncbi:MAG: hypothetical protein R3195_19925 [Gemmatimonadota bacterium]|nr:hypothetical protein [Gemmatimonadota bacterium]